ncbi:MAG: hypothetical protein JWO44_1570 [Bacteroidetes bacterium]|jgi:hypothetical protein|nr:hypothetical protein [Bacteroidota bacterium]
MKTLPGSFLAIALLFSMATTVNAQAKKKIPKVLKTGETIQCEGFEPQTDNGVPNYLRIRASRNTDAVIRLIDAATGKCIRYAFINQGEFYDIKNIPEGKYYVKVGLGKDWAFSDSTAHCEGGFRLNPIYKKLTKTFDFEMKQKRKGTSIPIYELDLDMTVSKGKEVKEVLISEKEFNK